MKVYLISLCTGILVGIIYSLLGVRSPAPPAVALVGLLGMLIGEQVLPPIKRMMTGEPVTTAWFSSECVPRITGNPPKEITIASAPQNDTPEGGALMALTSQVATAGAIATRSMHAGCCRSWPLCGRGEFRGARASQPLLLLSYVQYRN